MPDKEIIKRYMKQIAEDAERFAEAFDIKGDVGQNQMPGGGVEPMSHRTRSVTVAREPASQERHLSHPSEPPVRIGRNDGYASSEPQRQRDVTREVSEALGHELSIQRRMRGL